MSHEFQYEHPVSRRDLSSLVHNLVEDPEIGPKFEDFSVDTTIESMPMLRITTRIEDRNEEDVVIGGIRRCSYNALSFNITG